jgi:flagellar biosynthetic protein FliR
MIPEYQHEFLLLLLIFARVSMVISIGPFFMIKGVPQQVKVTFTVLLSFMILNQIRDIDLNYQFQYLNFVIAIMGEVFIGILIGMASNMIFAGIQMAGHIIGIDMGFAMSMFFDTSTNANLPVLSRFLYYMTFLIYLIIDGHHYLLGALFYSYEVAEPLRWVFSGSSMTILIKFVGDIFVIGMQVAAPVFITLFITSIALGFISKVVPQLNIFAVAFQIKILAGLLMLAIVVPIILVFFKTLFHGFEKQIFQLINTFIEV